MMMVIGCALVAIAAGWFLYKLWVSCSSARDFEVAVYDGAIYPPVLAVVGLFLLLREYEISWPFWIYLLIWIGLTLVAAAAIKGIEVISDRPLR